jgi:hypothetical protein
MNSAWIDHDYHAHANQRDRAVWRSLKPERKTMPDPTELLKYLFGRLKAERPVTTIVNDQAYAVAADGTLGAPIRALAPQWDKPAFAVATLSALAALYQAHVDDFENDVALHVVDYLTVTMVRTKADDYGRRHVYAVAKHAIETPFAFNNYMPAEKFLIDFRTSFLFNDDAVKVCTVISNLESGATVNVADDGLSQAIEIKSGTLSKTPVTLPADGIPLIPWRTFRDAAPVESKFLLRLKGIKDSLPQVALYDIDQKWKLDTANSVADWLRAKLPDATVIA